MHGVLKLVTDSPLVDATFTRAELDNLLGDFQSLSRSSRYLFFSPFVGSFPSHLVGSSRLVVRRRLVTSLGDSAARLVKMQARLKLNSRISATSLSSNARPPRLSLTFPCFLVLAPANSILAAGFN